MRVVNIAVIGMPGSGKTAIGREAAQRTGMGFIDTDDMIERDFGEIGALFEKGEPFFRDCETAAIGRAAAMQRMVISTGGGCVLRPENIAALRKNGRCVYIERPLAQIESDLIDEIRPLLKGKKHRLGELYRERKALYEAYADYTLRNDGDLESAIVALVRIIRRELP